MIVGFTGHRKLDINSQWDYVRDQIKNKLIELKPTKAVSGVAIGVDQLAADICIELNIPFIAAVPFVGQELIWPAEAKERYMRLLDFADEVVVVSPGKYAAWKLQRRNEYIVNTSDMIIAVYQPGKSGGTKNCLDYAAKKNKEVFRINPAKDIK